MKNSLSIHFIVSLPLTPWFLGMKGCMIIVILVLINMAVSAPIDITLQDGTVINLPLQAILSAIGMIDDTTAANMGIGSGIQEFKKQLKAVWPSGVKLEQIKV